MSTTCEPAANAQQGHRPPNVRQLGDLYSHTELDHGDLPHRHDREVNVLQDEVQLRHLQTKTLSEPPVHASGELYNTTAPIQSSVPRGSLKTDRNQGRHLGTTNRQEPPESQNGPKLDEHASAEVNDERGHQQGPTDKRREHSGRCSVTTNKQCSTYHCRCPTSPSRSPRTAPRPSCPPPAPLLFLPRHRRC